MPNKRSWPENCWYVASISQELKDKPLGRIICDKHIVFFRNDADKVVALEDFCPHRGLPLSEGFVEAGKITCGYHGLVVNCDGSCDSMPGQKVSRLRGIHAYPVIEKYGFIWLWPGEADIAEPELIPDLAWANSPSWAYGGDYYHMQCDYRLLIDNLMDLTHETYVHADSIGQAEIEDSAPSTTVEDGEVRVTRTMHSILAPPFWQDALKANQVAHDVLCDRWQICRFVKPSQVMIDVGVAHADCGIQNAADDKRASGIVVDLITPETKNSCHYFWGLARNFNVEDKELTATIRDSQGKIFAEDLNILEKQQASLLRNPDRRLISLNIDAGGVHARRVIDKMIQEEMH